MECGPQLHSHTTCIALPSDTKRFVSRFTGLSPCTMAQIPTRDLYFAPLVQLGCPLGACKTHSQTLKCYIDKDSQMLVMLTLGTCSLLLVLILATFLLFRLYTDETYVRLFCALVDSTHLLACRGCHFLTTSSSFFQAASSHTCVLNLGVTAPINFQPVS